jgi:hypothetical protein
MPDLLTLDFVSHVSIVDEPAVPDAEVLVAKRADEAEKAGRTLSQQNFEGLATILSAAEGGSLGDVRRQLRQFLTERGTEAQIEQAEVDLDGDGEAEKTFSEIISKDKNMSDDIDPEELVTSMKEAAEQMEDAAEQMEEAAEAQTEQTETTEGGGDPGDGEEQTGGSDTDEQSIREELQDLNDRIDQEFTTEEETEGEETEEEPDPTEVEVDPEADVEEQIEQMGKKVEAAMKAAGQDQQGRVGSRTSLGDGETEKSQERGLSFRGAVEKHRGSQSEEGEA